MKRNHVVLTVVVAVLIAGTLRAQSHDSKPLAFDVTSVKENTTVADGGSLRFMPDGGITPRHLEARTYISLAYQLQGYFQMVNAPDWLANTYYDVQAKPVTAVSREQSFVMLQALLGDRFQLRVHRELRQVDGYALAVVRAGQLGPGLRVSALNCEKPPVDGPAPRCREGRIGAGSMRVVGMSFYPLLVTAIGELAAPVVDETGLSGTFDFDLRWSNDLAGNADPPSLFTSLQEQLGLKLEPKRVPLELLVIDHVEKPTLD